MTLLRDIQSSAIDSNVRLSDLLRKCKVLSARLKNKEFEKWVDAELNGYQSKESLPDYRIIDGIAKGNLGGPYGAEMKNITIPASSLPANVREWAKTAFLTQPISSLEDLVTGKEAGSFFVEWPGDLIASVANKIYSGYNLYAAWLSIPKGAIIGAIDTVRNKILNFVLEIEKEAPDAGEAPPKSRPIPEEKVSQIYNTYITGNVHNLAAGNSNITQSQQIIISKGNFESLATFLKANDVLQEDIDLLHEAIKKDVPDKESKNFGKQVSAWIDKMLKKAETAAWKVGTKTAGSLLTKALAKYYGLE